MKVLIEIKGNKPLSAFGDNHVIAYDPKSKNYYVTTAESFFAAQSSKIKSIESKVAELNDLLSGIRAELTSHEESVLGEMRQYKTAMDESHSAFIQQYQKTNAQLLAMVKELVKNKEE